MTSEKTSVFTTIGWDGKRQFFAINEHLKRLEKHAIIADIKFNDIIKKDIISKMKTYNFKKINSRGNNELCKPPGLVKIELNEKGDITLSERSNELNLSCNVINAITIAAPIEVTENFGIKYGDHLPYKNAYDVAKEHNANAALLVHNNAIIDGDRATLMILDKDGTAWVSSEEYGSIKSITIDLIKDGLLKMGIPISFGKITTDLILRSNDAIMLGTGLGVTRVNSIDGRVFKFPNSILFDNVKSVFSELMNKKWVDLK